MGITDRVKARAKHPTGGAVTGRIAGADPRLKHARVNQAAGWVGHSKGVQGTSIDDARNHNSAPLSTLKDPSSFGPPPKNVHYHGEASASATSSPVASNPPALPAASKPTISRPAPSKPIPTRGTPGGLGVPVPQSSIKSKEEEERLAAEKAANAGPPVPYRVDTTGLTTAGLPKPPVRRVDSSDSGVAVRPAPVARQVMAKPQPPPRLPARQNSNPTELTPPGPPAYAAATGAESQYEPQHQPAAPTSMNQLSELQSRFNRMPGRVSSPPAPPPLGNQSPMSTSPQVPEQTQSPGTAWAQKQAALRTAGQFHQDPSSVSASDARAAAGTARDFHEKHGDQVASGWQRAKAMDSKYGMRGKIGSMVQGQEQNPPQQQPPATVGGGGLQRTIQPTAPSGNAAAAAASKKPPPPPPPPKRRELQASGGQSSDGPPPVPLSSKPSW